ncbi:MAG: hypothetical protein JSU70_22875, partial [Phycisphaerales bacterium]
LFASFVLVPGLVAGVANADITSGLVGYYPLDEGAGDTAHDMSGNGHDGTLYNGATWISDGFISGGVNFDGVTNSRIELGTWNPAEGTGQLSLALWIRWAGGGGTYQGLIGKRDTWPETTMFQFQVRPENSGTFRLETGTYAVVSPNGTLAPFVQTWAHVAATFDGTRCRLYLNGQEIVSGGFAFNSAGEGSNMGIGCVTGGGDGYSGNNEVFLGDIDEVYIHNRALSVAEIKSMIPLKLKAYEPDPEDGATGVDSPLLQWEAGDTAVSHNVYFGTNPTPGDAEFIMEQTWTVYWHAAGLTPATTYYWRIDEIELEGTVVTGDVWSFTSAPLTALNPVPRDGMKWVDPDADVSWSAGLTAISHDVYFGTDETAVANGDASVFIGNQGPESYDPGPLAEDTTYYWRIDEKDASNTYEGEVWSFTTSGSPYAGVKAEYYHWTGAAVPPPRSVAFGTLVLTRIEPEINHHWGGESPDPLDNFEQFAARWTAELEVAFSEPYTIWTLSDDGVRVWVDGELIIDDWNDHGDTWNSSQPIDLVAGQRYALVMEYFENAGGATAELNWESPSIPRQVIAAGPLQLPLRAVSPDPRNGATGVKETPTLRWKAGEQAVQHDVFFGTNRDAVANADTTTAVIYRGRQGGTSYVPPEAPLEWEQTYYWKINEVNGANTWEGSVWSFTVADYIIVEDFEDYNDYSPDRIFQTWIDGFGYSEPAPGKVGNGTGSTVGYLSAPFAEQTIVHGGGQSMPFGYDNTGAGGKARYSEAEREYPVAQNFSEHGVKALSLWVYGDPDNAPAPLYVGLQDSTGARVDVPDTISSRVRTTSWQEVFFDLSKFAPVNLTSVKKIYIGVGDRLSPSVGGTGNLFVDDIGLYLPRCRASVLKPDADLNSDCVVDYLDVEVMANAWLDTGLVVIPEQPSTAGLVAYYALDNNTQDGSGSGHDGTAQGAPTFVPGPAGYGMGLEFDGTVGQYVDLGTWDPSGGTGQLTVTLWAKWNGLSGVWQGLIGKRDTWDTSDMMWQIEADIDTGTLGFFRLGSNPDDGDPVLPLGEWAHVGASFDGTTATFYFNGEATGSGPFSFGTDTESALVFGAVEGGGGNPFNGALDEIRLYNRPLSQAEVAWLAGKTEPFTAPFDLNADDAVDFLDVAILGGVWLDEMLWPAP